MNTTAATKVKARELEERIVRIFPELGHSEHAKGGTASRLAITRRLKRQHPDEEVGHALVRLRRRGILCTTKSRLWQLKENKA